MKNMTKKIYLKNKKITFILVVAMLLSMTPIVFADDVTITLEFYGPDWDINHEGTDNYLDVSSLVAHYGDMVPPRPRPPGEYRWDITGDGNTNYLDVSSLVNHYGEVWLVP